MQQRLLVGSELFSVRPMIAEKLLAMGDTSDPFGKKNVKKKFN